MDRVLLDTNVLLDFFSTTRSDHDVVVALLVRMRAAKVSIAVAATSLKDTYYVLSRSDGEPVARQAVTSAMATMDILPIDAECCRTALAGTEPDFEDGLIRTAAETAELDYIISRDTRAFTGSRVPRLTPADALRELTPRASATSGSPRTSAAPAATGSA